MSTYEVMDQYARNLSPSNVMLRQRRPSLMVLSLSESLFTMDSIVDSFQSKSTCISEDNVSSDCDKGCCDVNNTSRRHIERNDYIRGAANELSKKYEQPNQSEAKEFQGRSIVEPVTIWPDFRTADPQRSYVTDPWSQRHVVGKRYMATLLRQLSKLP
ncbi:uncharacterized protein LOC104266535 isoform X1 [Ciona intestinalis]